MPLRSEDAEAAVGDVLATVLVLVSVMWILETGMPKQREATYKRTSINVTIQLTNNNQGREKSLKNPRIDHFQEQDVTSVKRRNYVNSRPSHNTKYFSRGEGKNYRILRDLV